jgi:uncharacterized membrane protein
MTPFLKLYAIALPVFFAIDIIWLGFIGRGFYQKQIGSLMKTDVNWTAAIIFYLLFIVGMIVFVIVPALEKGDWMQALWRGALYGLITYATYDLTNYATLRDWPLTMVIVDMIWGTVLAASVSVVTYLISVKMGLWTSM